MRASIQKQPPSQQSTLSNITKLNTTTPAAGHNVYSMLRSQHMIGSQPAQQPEKTKPADLEVQQDNERSTRFAHDFCLIRIHAKLPENLQTKLSISSPGDIYEQEADRVSTQVISMPAPRLQRACAVNGERPKCQIRQSGQEYPRLQTKSSGLSGTAQTTVPPIVHEVLRSPGQPLDTATRNFLEPRFGHDFSKVRIHADAKAAESASSLNALAYTLGRNVVFGAGQYQPNTRKGQQLLAHELSHTIQQGATARRQPQPGQSEMAMSAMQNIPPTIQRAMGFEFQTENIITTNKGKILPRKFPNKKQGLDECLHKGKTGVELQADTGSVVEFQTDFFVNWPDLKAQIQEASDIANEIKKNPNGFQFSEEDKIKSKGLLKKNEKLVVKLSPDKNKVILHDDNGKVIPYADIGIIQSSEGIALSQYESLLKEHEAPIRARSVVNYTNTILETPDQRLMSSTGNLRGFLQVIVNYIMDAQNAVNWFNKVLDTEPIIEPAKATFFLMSRTSFSSMFNSILSSKEKQSFTEIVMSNAIPKKLGISATAQLFNGGYWGHFKGKMVLFLDGEIVAVATENKKLITNCLGASGHGKTSQRDALCGTKVPKSKITIGGWLTSIITSEATDQHKDLLSPPYLGSKSMGKLPVRAEGVEKGLAVFEVRAYNSKNRNRDQPYYNWVSFAENVFMQALKDRPRSDGTGLKNEKK